MLNHLALVMSLILSGQTYALEMLEDESLSDVTGEGVAFLPENFAMVFRGANAATLDVITGQYKETTLTLADRTKDTGYIRYIPVGPLTATATAAGAGKGDLFLYGLAISRGDADFNNRFNSAALNAGKIEAWGTSGNPWLFKVQTQASVPDFTSAAPTDTSTGSVTYLSLEAPLYHKTLPATRATGLDAYNLKLAMWADAFVRRSDVAENMTATGTQFDVNGGGRANRLRLQAVWDGFSINGSEIRLFQTLAGATNTGGLSTFYNNTLGLTGLLRFNSGATNTLRAIHTYTAGSRTVEAYTVTWNGLKYTLAPAPNYTDTSGVSGGAVSPNCANIAAHNAAGSSCRIRYQTRATIDSASSTTWTPPTLSSALRFNTQETGAVQGLLETSAINGTSAPTFNATEGMYIYNPNINLVVGQMYQPLVVGVAPDGRNLMLEVARIPNKELIYKKIYTNYDNSNSGTNGGYLGSTCNVHRCGADRSLYGVDYQGNSATHSSISIGSTVWSGTGTPTSFNLLTAYSGIEAFGVSFGALTAGSASTAAQSYRDVQSSTRATATGVFGAYANLGVGSSALFNAAAFSPNTWTQQAALAAPAFVQAKDSVPLNNLGSAVIDGMLIQHLKITTKGL
ncbi:MAG: hypothetical protein Q7S87_08125 [Agitococcus sp.]|nr:hypothetical protein [Agitococcus sp.]